MSKTPAQDLVEETCEELSTYLKSGKINENQLNESLDFEGLDIEDFDRLKTIHFVLSEEVTEFTKKLPERIRRIKTESDRQDRISRGEISGRIDWNKTLKTRYSQNYRDKSLFVTKNPEIEYNIPENLVLKKVLGIIYETLTEDLEKIEYSWRKESWSDQNIDDLQQIFRKNIHIKRIKNHKSIKLTGKELEAARKSRQEHYQDAYNLYIKYKKLQENDFSEEDVSSLLDETLVVPKQIETLFELYSVFKLIKKLRAENQLKYQPIVTESSAIAVMENEEQEIKVYHNEQGNLTFREEPPENLSRILGDNNDNAQQYLKRYAEALEDHKETLDALLGRNSNQDLYRGRPDIIVEFYDKKGKERNLSKVIIGEVKYTDKESTFSTGLKELFEYLKFGKESDYLENNVELNGIIITDKVHSKEIYNELDYVDLQAWNTEKMREF